MHLQRDDALAIGSSTGAVRASIGPPRLRGELARLYGILANDPDRALVDEYLLGQILGTGFTQQIARELDGDRPLRRYGLIGVAAGERPFAGLTIDPLVVRYIANQSPDGEPDPHLKVRHVDRDLAELQLPRPVVLKAVRFLAGVRDGEPVRIVVRGRAGSGRHTLLTSLAARAGRSLGVIDLSTIPREPRRAAPALEAALRRAMLRGLVPCIDGLELISPEDPDAKIQIGAALRNHPGPIALRLPAEARIPLDPGYLLLDVPQRGEQLRAESWTVALERHHIELADTSELAARYRVGPGIIERVCAEVVRRPERPTDPAAWIRELDDAVRQHLENRLGTTANRVTRLASWADIVLPEDITDSLLELTARVRHRKIVYEQWGFDRSMTTSRGITALFQGSPGTGKTMVAGVIARDLGLELNYLLQRLDSFEGIAILTTNFGSAIDRLDLPAQPSDLCREGITGTCVNAGSTSSRPRTSTGLRLSGASNRNQRMSPRSITEHRYLARLRSAPAVRARPRLATAHVVAPGSSAVRQEFRASRERACPPSPAPRSRARWWCHARALSSTWPSLIKSIRSARDGRGSQCFRLPDDIADSLLELTTETGTLEERAVPGLEMPWPALIIHGACSRATASLSRVPRRPAATVSGAARVRCL